jgi:eukaryotic-like serine/threonine-protein kinase
VSDPERLRPGQLIADRYRVSEVVGRGAMGVVYAGDHVRVGRRVAIKVLTRAWSNEPTIRQRFEAEARAASAAGHPNVIQVLDVGELSDSRLYSVMEFVDGSNLYHLLWAEGPLAPARACRLVRDAAFGVRAAHARGVIHRDLKLENVMVQSLPEGEVVKVLDFGIAAGVITTARATVAGMALGTPEYMAPEQVDGKPPTVRFDIYALGVMLFELLTKRLPIEADNPLMLMALKGHQAAPRVVTLRPELPPALDQLIADCLEIDPERRPASCEIFLERLTDIMTTLEPAPEARKTLAVAPGTPPPRPSRLTRPYLERDGSKVSVASVRVAGRPSARLPLAWLLAGVSVPLVAAAIGLAWYSRPGHELEDPIAAAPTLAVESTLEPASGEVPPEPLPVALPVAPPPEVPRVDPDPVTRTDPPSDDDPHDPSATTRCEKVRARALDARGAHDWQGVLDAAKQRECWAHARDRKKLETQAFMELGRFAECLRAGKNLTDTDVQKWVKICNKRLAG